MSDLVRGAFASLGMGPTRREIALVAEAIRESGDEEAIALFEDAAIDFKAAVAALEEIAVEAGSSAITVLDLLPEVLAAGWSPFPMTSTTPAQEGLERRIEAIREQRGVTADGS